MCAWFYLGILYFIVRSVQYRMLVDVILVCLLLWQVACVQLINALVSTPDDLDFRLHLRNEFVREGLNDPLQVYLLEMHIQCIYNLGKFCLLVH